MNARARIRAAVVVGVGLFGLWLRARGAPAPGLWHDEFFTAFFARGDGIPGIVRRAAIGLQPPLYPLLARASCALLGESESALRLPALVAGAALPVVSYLSVGRIGGRRAGACALVVFAVLFPFVWQSRQARAYPVAELGALLALGALPHALERGTRAARFATWAPAVLAVYAHYTFAPILVAIALGAWIARTRAYPRARVVLDAALAGLALGPAGLAMATVARKISDTSNASADPATQALVASLGTPPVLLVLGAIVALHVVAARILLRETRGSSDEARAARGVVVALFVADLLPLTPLVVFFAAGLHMTLARYLSLALVAQVALAARLVRRAPRVPAAIALAVAAVSLVSFVAPERPQIWQVAAPAINARLDELRPGRGEPLLLAPEDALANLVVRGPLDPDLEGALLSTIELRPGKPDAGRSWTLLPADWDTPGRAEWSDRVLVPLLEAKPRFYVVGSPRTASALAAWVAERFHGRFKQALAETYESPLVLERWDASR